MFHNKDLLIVDDDANIARNMAAFLSTHGYRVEYRLNGEEALEVYKEINHPVVLLDIVMPGISGLEVLDEIVKINPRTQVLMISGQDDQETIESAMKKGAYDFIGKPIKLEILIRRVHLAYLEYLSRVLNIELEAQITKHFEAYAGVGPRENEDIEAYLKNVDIQINRELAVIITELNKKFLIKE